MSVGVVIVTHYGLGEEFLQAVRLIVPGAPAFESVAVDPGRSVDELRKAIREALARADEGEGVLVLTDMFGGTPSNLSLSFLGERKVEVVTGLNLPMLIKLAEHPRDRSVEELAALIKSYGQRNIRVASELLPDGDR